MVNDISDITASEENNENNEIIEPDINLESEFSDFAIDLPEIEISEKTDKPSYVVEDDAKKVALKFGIIGSGQGGCIAGRTNIYVSGQGIIKIEELFNEAKSNVNMADITVTDGRETCIRLHDVYTIGINPETGEAVRTKVKAVWKHRPKKHNRLLFKNNSELHCSTTHPTFVFRPNAQTKIFAQSLSNSTPLQINDRVLDSRGTVLDVSNNQNQILRGVQINPDIGWLLGLFAGDGSCKREKNGNDVSFYLDDEAVVIKAKSILDGLSFVSSTNVFDAPGCKRLIACGLQTSLFFKSAFNFEGGDKQATVRIPRCVSASSPLTRLAFLAGVVDSDTEVAARWCEADITTVSKDFADELACLASTLGMRAVVAKRKPGKKGKQDEYHISFSGKYNFGPLMDQFITFITHSLRGSRLTKYAESEQKSFITSSTVLEFGELEPWLRHGGFVNGNQTETKYGVGGLKAWIRGERSLSLPKFDKLLEVFESKQLDYVKKIAPQLCTIKKIEGTNTEEFFYDLSVEGTENYFAGNNGFILTHNSRLTDTFYQIGYRRVCAINTTNQDFLGLSLPSDKQLVMQSQGGAGKDPNKGYSALKESQEDVLNLMRHSFGEDVERIMVTVGSGGGSGTGSAIGLFKLAQYYLKNLGKPEKVGMMVTLPKKMEGGKVQGNAYGLMKDLMTLADTGSISPLIIVDNETIHQMFPNVSAKEFWNTANKNTVGLFDIFNVLACQKSAYVTFDKEDYRTVLDSGAIIFGATKLNRYDKNTDISDGLRTNLKRTLLAGLDITEASHIAAVLCAPDKILSILPQKDIDLAFTTLERIVGGENREVMVHQGIYETRKMGLYLYTMVGGLKIPEDRLNLMRVRAGLKEKD